MFVFKTSITGMSNCIWHLSHVGFYFNMLQETTDMENSHILQFRASHRVYSSCFQSSRKSCFYNVCVCFCLVDRVVFKCGLLMLINSNPCVWQRLKPKTSYFDSSLIQVGVHNDTDLDIFEGYSFLLADCACQMVLTHTV